MLLHEAHITIIWTADNSGVNTPPNTGNQVQPVLPNPVIVDPLPGCAVAGNGPDLL
ncbi:MULTISPECIES: hypothetical protein [unclassified Kosakonia]|uniref:hypothetical protein n=1 Tax=unclassified Kosakonia TaxID=2632876 RepID=UPI0031B6DA75